MRARILAQVLAGGLIIDGVRRFVRHHANSPSRPLGLAEVSLGLVILSRVPVTVSALYRVVAPVYDPMRCFFVTCLGSEIHQTFDRLLLSYVTPDARILELGCGTAANLERIGELRLTFSSYLGVDLSDAMLEEARAKCGDLPQVSFAQLDLLTDPLPDGPFDLILSTWVFEALPDPLPVVVKARERLRPGGHAVFLFLADNHAWYMPLLQLFLRLFRARFVSDDVVRRFPGLVTHDHFFSGLQTMVVLKGENTAVAT